MTRLRGWGYPVILAAMSLYLVGRITWQYYWPAGGGLDVSGHQIGRDFINIWAGPQLAFSGRGQLLFDFEAYHVAIGELFGQPLPFHNWGAAPFMLILLRPFSLPPYFVALALWTISTLGIYLAVAACALERERRLQGVVLLTLAPASLINGIGGQNGFVTASLFLGAFLVLDRRQRLAGALFGLLTMKPHLGLVVPAVLLISRAWRAIGAAIAVVAILVIVSAATFGIEPWRDFLTITSAYQAELLVWFQGYYIYMMSSVYAAVRTFGGNPDLAMAVQLAVAVPVIIITTLAFPSAGSRVLKVQLVASAAALTTPYLFQYDLTALSAVAVWRLLPSSELTPGNRTFYSWVWLSPALTFFGNVLQVGLLPLFAFAVFVAALRDIHAERSGARLLVKSASLEVA